MVFYIKHSTSKKLKQPGKDGMRKSYYQHKLLTASKINFNNDLKKYSTIL